MEKHKLENPLDFVKAGKAIFTIKNEESGNRFTYKIKKVKDKDIYFVCVLRGSNNLKDYAYIGTIFDKDFKLTKNSKFDKNATSVKTLNHIRKIWRANYEKI